MGAEPGVAGPQHPDTGFRTSTARRALRSVIQVPRPLRGVPRARSQRAGKFGAADVPALAERSRVQPVLPGQSEPRGSARPGPSPGFAPSPRLSFPGHPKTERARPVASWGMSGARGETEFWQFLRESGQKISFLCPHPVFYVPPSPLPTASGPPAQALARNNPRITCPWKQL